MPFLTLITSPKVIVAGVLNFKMDAPCFDTVSEEVIYALNKKFQLGRAQVWQSAFQKKDMKFFVD